MFRVYCSVVPETMAHLDGSGPPTPKRGCAQLVDHIELDSRDPVWYTRMTISRSGPMPYKNPEDKKRWRKSKVAQEYKSWYKENYERLGKKINNPNQLRGKDGTSLKSISSISPNKLWNWANIAAKTKKRYNGGLTRQQKRNIIFAIYGPNCAKCGFSDRRALQIDHVNGDGHKERKGKASFKVEPKIINEFFPGTYQILCANCNTIKAVEEGNQNGNNQHLPVLDMGVSGVV